MPGLACFMPAIMQVLSRQDGNKKHAAIKILLKSSVFRVPSPVVLRLISKMAPLSDPVTDKARKTGKAETWGRFYETVSPEKNQNGQI
jgi:hypothetical protein